MTTTTNMNHYIDINEMLKKMEEYKFPSSLLVTHHDNDHTTSSSSSSSSSVHLMDQYKKARDIYLQRKVIHNLIDHVTTHFDSHHNKIMTDNLQIPNDDDTNHLYNQQQNVLTTITNKASMVQQKRIELQNKYLHYQQRREELYQLLQQQQQKEDENDTTNIDIDHDVLDTTTTMEYDTQLVQQDTYIRQLHDQHAQVQVQLSNLKQQHKIMTQTLQQNKEQLQKNIFVLSSSSSSASSSESDNDKKEADIRDLINQDWVEHPNEATLLQLQLQNSTLQSQVSKVKDIESYYKNLLELLETLNGIKFISSTCTQNDTAAKCMIITIQVLQKYIVEVCIDMKTSNFYIQSAILISDNAIVTGRPIQNGYKNNTTKDNDMVIQLRIPSFDDIVQYVNMTSTKGENLRILFREIIARLTMIEQRVEMFTELQEINDVVSTIGPFCTVTTTGSNTTSNGNIGNTTTTMLHDQEVVCSLNYPPMTVVLRCTGDCPLIENGIYIDELHGLGSGWDTNILNGIVLRINNNDEYNCTTPKQILVALRNEIQLLITTQQLIIPNTPRLPIRHNINNTIINQSNNNNNHHNNDDNNDDSKHNSSTNVFF